ncbi:Myb-like DNA-binding domain-containing protein [Spironucleus salmonicida]|uniref:Myb-like DNA-binding domain-containing protein n=1 Tax=Spironucleus salmonicida TaxID=348837 RepID=V6LFW3_9EUKA|nr:Myb-like DNA-binding domain-containing protein [Spironucleus salmonicida]KAH0572801.1 Myb-like DNA-binding domain-containing protein [Spironucleus salmonicida]|eukprot:EST43441.1 Myb-like DNA-binding domain-containing protein [Spironucleus salmonicida]
MEKAEKESLEILRRIEACFKGQLLGELLHAKSTHPTKQFWTKQQDEMLHYLKQTHLLSYGQLAQHINEQTQSTFTAKQCQQHWTRVIQPGIVKGRWSQEEDHMLKMLITDQQLSCRVASKVLTTRTSQQIWKRCRDMGIDALQ